MWSNWGNFVAGWIFQVTLKKNGLYMYIFSGHKQNFAINKEKMKISYRILYAFLWQSMNWNYLISLEAFYSIQNVLYGFFLNWFVVFFDQVTKEIFHSFIEVDFMLWTKVQRTSSPWNIRLFKEQYSR